MSNERIESLYKFYSGEIVRLSNLRRRTKNGRIKSKIFIRMMKLKDKYDWTYDEIFKRGLLQFKSSCL